MSEKNDERLPATREEAARRARDLAHDQALYAFEGETNIDKERDRSLKDGAYWGFDWGFDAGYAAGLRRAAEVIEANYFAGPTRDMILGWLLAECSEGSK